ncbi:7819_t:CDS:1 [Cetraspora pellucida]|uniref:7819_t:CDS:1 n=1 Tax=Cetraspora pellucida TaxID=1433469 RepID=A0A9N9CVE8_9GLOM|nr:7819_t:CDS:1 [Cetraspora pellucida]
MQYKLLNIFKSFIYNIQNKINKLVLKNLINVNYFIVIKHKEQSSKRLKINIKKSLYKRKKVLLNSININIIENNTSNSIKNLINNTKNQKYKKSISNISIIQKHIKILFRVIIV